MSGIKTTIERYGLLIKSFLDRVNNYKPNNAEYRKAILQHLYKGLFPNIDNTANIIIDDNVLLYEEEVNDTTSILNLIAYDPSQDKSKLWIEFKLSDIRLLPVMITGHNNPILWVDKHTNGIIKSGILKIKDFHIFDFFNMAINEITYMGLEYGWGNIQELTLEGFTNAINHLQEYDFKEFIVYKNSELELDFEIEHEVQKVDWIFKDLVVIVPKEKSNLGNLILLKDSYSAIIENPTRAIGICYKVG